MLILTSSTSGVLKFRTDFAALLSADQRILLDKLKAASGQLGALAALGILDGGVRSGLAIPLGSPGGVGFVTKKIVRSDR